MGEKASLVNQHRESYFTRIYYSRIRTIDSLAWSILKPPLNGSLSGLAKLRVIVEYLD